MTRQRALILDIMRQQRPLHLTADEIFCHARQQMPHIARGTVYRNLKLMENDGEVAHLEMAGGPDRSRHWHRGARLHADHPLSVPQMSCAKRTVIFSRPAAPLAVGRVLRYTDLIL